MAIVRRLIALAKGAQLRCGENAEADTQIPLRLLDSNTM